ncbi:hypothetical protein LWI29_019315 [Acer saccharum]|uniref:Uncharacterized protein n=1 Tax=Acer saccharum TaxID=4024 RepID=A0AA39VY95_ACESA|nr:hypothetical protein LWI29_019315 [Acer saccharum]
MDYQTLPKLPVIDFSKEDLKPGTQTWFSTCKEICQALEKHGCFIVECKDVSLDLHNKIFDAAKELHDLPIDVKRKNFSDKPYRGYFSASSVHESLGIDNVIALESTKNFTNLMWPQGNDLFCTKANKIARTMMDLDQMVIRMVFESYGVEKYYDSHIVSTDYVLRFNKYKEYIEDHIGLPIHTDKTLTTIIHQNHINGLEVQIRDGEWVTYDPPSHSSFLYFAGVAFQTRQLHQLTVLPAQGSRLKGKEKVGEPSEPVALSDGTPSSRYVVNEPNNAPRDAGAAREPLGTMAPKIPVPPKSVIVPSSIDGAELSHPDPGSEDPAADLNTCGR